MKRFFFAHRASRVGCDGRMYCRSVEAWQHNSKAHWGKPIWVTQGGGELPVTNIAAALALTLLGPGRFSLDRLFGIRVPRWLVVSAVTVEAVTLAIDIMSRPTPPAAASSEQKTTAGATKS